MSLILQSDQFERIKAQVEDAYPYEACGLLLGSFMDTQYIVHSIWPAKNILAHQIGRFEIDPKDRLQAEKYARSTHCSIIGHWHSHPNGEAIPSETDRAMVYEPNLVWLILATLNHSITHTNAFFPPQQPSDAFSPLDLHLLP